MKRKSMKQYEEYLNELSPSYGDDINWIIGGKDRRSVYYPGRWGTAMRKFDQIAFNVGYREWIRI